MHRDIGVDRRGRSPGVKSSKVVEVSRAARERRHAWVLSGVLADLRAAAPRGREPRTLRQRRSATAKPRAKMLVSYPVECGEKLT